MSKLVVTAIAIGLIIAITSVMQIALELTPREPHAKTVYQPIYVTVPLEREVVRDTITVTVGQAVETMTMSYTVTVTQYSEPPSTTLAPPITTIVITDISYITETVTHSIINTVTETVTLANYAEHKEISIQLLSSPGSEIMFSPDNMSVTVVSGPSISAINLLSLGVKDLVCIECSLRIARFGGIDALEITPRGSSMTVEIHTLSSLDINRGMLLLYAPGRSDMPIGAVHVKVGEAIVHISRDFYRYYVFPSGVLIFVPLSGVPRIDGVRMVLHVWNWQESRIVIIPIVSPSYRPTVVQITPPTSVLSFMLKNGLCRSEYSWYAAKHLMVCNIEIFAEVITTSKVIEYREQSFKFVSFYIDQDVYYRHGLISVVKIYPEPRVELQMIPLDDYEAKHTMRIVVRPGV